MTTESPCRINGVKIMEVKIQRINLDLLVIYADYALLEQHEKESPLTHGKCTVNPMFTKWSQKTRATLKELIESMEVDLLPQHFNTEEKTNERFGSESVKEDNQV